MIFLKVKILSYTPNCEKLIATSSKQTLSRKPIEKDWEKMDEKTIETWIRETFVRGHLSPWEHCVYTFYIEGVSRVLTHQLVRHRLASYSQYSQRYKKMKEDMLETIIPPRIKLKGKEAEKIFEEATEQAARAYNKLLELGVPPEDARYLLPQAVQTKIIVTMNARELLHFFGLRTCTKAQWEIRALAWLMWKKVFQIHPLLWKWGGPRCILQENMIREKPITIFELAGPLDPEKTSFNKTQIEQEVLQETCPERVPRNSIPSCIRAGYRESINYISRFLNK